MTNIEDHPVWAEVAATVAQWKMPERAFRTVTADSFGPPSDPRVQDALDALASGDIGLQQFIYRMALLECEDEQ